MKTTNYRWDYKISLGGTEQMMGLGFPIPNQHLSNPLRTPQGDVVNLGLGINIVSEEQNLENRNRDVLGPAGCGYVA